MKKSDRKNHTQANEMLCRISHLSHTIHVLKKCHIVVSQATWVSHIMPLNQPAFLSLSFSASTLLSSSLVADVVPAARRSFSSSTRLNLSIVTEVIDDATNRISHKIKRATNLKMTPRSMGSGPLLWTSSCS